MTDIDPEKAISKREKDKIEKEAPDKMLRDKHGHLEQIKFAESGDLTSTVVNMATALGALNERVNSLESALSAAQHFIDSNLRPDVAHAAFKSEGEEEKKR